MNAEQMQHLAARLREHARRPHGVEFHSNSDNADLDAAADLIERMEPAREPLSDEQISDLSRTMVKGGRSVEWLCRAIEQAHGIGSEK